MKLYKRSNDKSRLLPSLMGKMEWFALTSDYGVETYGELLGVYKIKKELRLLNLNTMNARKFVARRAASVGGDYDYIMSLLHPDEMYSGSAQNERAHRIIRDAVIGDFDGTFIDKSSAPDDDELAGPSEVVLFGKMTDLIKKVK